jgi:trehalose 6-phosphate phosphatase
LALFLDVDGTLVPFAPTPQAVVIDPGLRQLIDQLAHSLDGALAVVSGRTLGDLERLFGATTFALIGEHGSAQRWPERSATLADAEYSQALDAVRDALNADLAQDPRLLLEHKGSSLALHYRRAPERAEWAAARMAALATALGEPFHVLRGAAVVELRPTNIDKGAAVRALMQAAPFKGRQPIYLGDDETDRPALAAVAALDGVPIAVGPRLLDTAYERLEGPSHVREMLLGLSVALQRAQNTRRA